MYLRADGNSQIGLGHIHRMLALSEILRQHFSCKFIIRAPLPGVRELISKNCDEIIELDESDDIEELNSILKPLTGKEIVVLDGYHFSTSYQSKIKQSGCGLVCVDDIHHQHYVADVIINPAGGVDAKVYSKETNTVVFTGPAYAFLKGPFRMASKNRSFSKNNSMFICMGGADPENHTLQTLKQCFSFPFDTYRVIVGEAYPYINKLQQEVKQSGKRVEVLSNLGPSELAETMKQCSTAVCSASGIAYEYLSVGGELYVKQTAANQKLLYEYLINEGLSFRYADFRVDSEKVDVSLFKQSKVFDGNSDTRILKIFNRLDFKTNASVRKAQTDDLMLIFHWINDPELRRQSYNSEPIPLEDHTKWFNKKLKDTSTYIYIFVYTDIPVAQVRFDVGDEAVISYSIDKSYRGRAWGEPVIQQAIEIFRHDSGLPIKIVGYVKYENESSNRVFRNLGFTQHKTEVYPDSHKYEYLKS